MPQPTELDTFIALSRVLTGEKKLAKTLADQYLQRLKPHYAAPLQDLLAAFAEIADDKYLVFEVKRRIMDNKDRVWLAQQIIRIWYTSEFVVPGPDGKPSPDGKAAGGTQPQYYSGLLWNVIHAHPPTHSKQGYGYWATRPTLK